MSISLAQVVVDARRRWPDRIALIDGGKRLTYRELGDAVARCAGAFAARGVRRGDRVALMAPNTIAFPIVYYAVLSLGATVVPVHLLLTADEIEHVLSRTGAVCVVADVQVREVAAAAAARTGTPLLVLDDGSTGGPGERFDPMAHDQEPWPAITPVEDDAIAVILYTSGTTGVPKGAMLTHANLVWNAVVSARDVVSLTSQDRVFGAAPLFHSNGQTVVMNAAFCSGAALVLVRRFDATAALELMEREAVTVFVGVPTMYAALLDAAREGGPRPRPRLRLAVSGAAPLPAVIVEQFHDVFGADIYEGYGLTEASPVLTFNQSVFGRRSGSIGHPIWGLDVEIARADVEDGIELVPVGEVGEVVARGHAVFAGYLDDPAATAAAIRDGWLRTGDLGRKDDDGFVYIAGRKKEMILRGGYNVYPREVEDVLSGHPDVSLVAVVGGPDDLYGEEVHAFVVLTASGRASESDIIAWSRDRLARYKYPRHVHIRESLPLSSSGKVLKQRLAAELAPATRS